MVPICLDKSPHQINSLWADFSKQMGTICWGQTTRPAAMFPASVALPAPSEDVRRVQIALSALGFDAGPADGMLGDKTREAIRAFETYRGLDKTGAVNARLARELGISLAAGG